jgi:hypothetical protein
MQVHQTKIRSYEDQVEIEYEFTIFLSQGWNPFKIHGRFKLEYVPKFITSILLRI